MLLAAVLLCTTAFAAQEPVSSTQLIEQASSWDGKQIAFEGEAVGEVLRHGQWAWINVSDSQNTIGCYVDAAQAEQIQLCGRYGVTGDTLRIEGVFSRACAEHGGDADIHVEHLQILQTGEIQKITLSPKLLTVTCVNAVIAICLLVAVILRKRRHAE